MELSARPVLPDPGFRALVSCSTGAMGKEEGKCEANRRKEILIVSSLCDFFKDAVARFILPLFHHRT